MRTDFLVAAGAVSVVILIGAAFDLPAPAIIGGSVAALSGSFFRAAKGEVKPENPAAGRPAPPSPR